MNVVASELNFVKLLVGNQPAQCFANAGTIIMPIDYRTIVRSISTGNNVVDVGYYNGGCCDKTIRLAKYTTKTIDPSWFVKSFTIL